MLKAWDEATKHQRKALLDEFAGRYRDAHMFETTVDLDEDLGSSAGLYLSRIVSWLRLNCTDGDGLTQHIHAVAVFLRGHYVQEFVEMEGVPVLLYVLSFPTHAVTDADCAAVIHLLQTLGRCGRSFKEYISHCGGERSVVQCCIARSPRVSCDSELLLTSHAMLLEQCSGNPNSTTATFAALHLLLDSNHVSLVRMASQIVCELVSTKSPHYDARVIERIWDLVPTAITLLGNDSVKVQYDALELVHILLHDSSNHHALCTELLRWLRDAAVKPDHNLPKTADEFYEVECFMHAKSHVVRICHCLDSILLHCPPFAATIIGLHGVDALVYVVLASTEGSVKWQAACFTLLRLCVTHEGTYGVLAETCQHSTSFVRDILSDTAQLTTTKDTHEIELDTCMEMLVGDAAHQSTIWRHLYNQKWPLRPVVMLERDDEYDDHTLETLAAQVEATITPVRQDFAFEDGLLADETSPPQHGDHYYIQKLHTHFQKYRRPVQEAAHNHA
ncbi:hypothetical protein, variant [Aphanomyces astaci]|uniref:Uncharacterized protein n=1 Tax=Aphanomyces astaci TaxID=112090 RepID=W4HCH1_APHAT|nr:hypothetical protein, variant [Aphanomyces astaci]ETV88823.1 hypothetical protein, variant [Aphanomyces astaci]|eukprot:XP_009821223.1 hypothetical protein, variant [Aphanomyces astaci]